MYKHIILILLAVFISSCGSDDERPVPVNTKEKDKRLESLPPELKKWGEEKNLSYDELMKVFDLVYSPTELNWVIPEDKKVWVPKIIRITPDMVGTIIGPHWSHNPQGTPYMAFESPKKIPLKVRHIKTKYDPASHHQQMKSAIEKAHLKERNLNNYEELKEDK